MYHLSDTDTTSEIDSHYNFGAGNLNIEEVMSLIPQNSSITIETNKASKENLDDFKKDIRCLKNANSSLGRYSR